MENLQETLAMIDKISLRNHGELLRERADLMKLLRRDSVLADNAAKYIIDKIRKKSYDKNIVENLLSLLSPSRDIKFSNEIKGEISKMLSWKVWKKMPEDSGIRIIASSASC